MMHDLTTFEVAEEVIDAAAAAEEHWHEQRAGKITASNFGRLMGTGRDRNAVFTKDGYTYLRLKLAEMQGSYYAFSNAATQHGKDNEAAAIALYAERTGADVDSTPFRFLPWSQDDRVGGTPDGLVGTDGTLEVKCPHNPAVHINTVLSGQVPSEYHWQVIGHCLIAERPYCDFVSFDPRMAGPNRIKVIRCVPTEGELSSLATRLGHALEWLEEQKQKLGIAAEVRS